MYKIKEAIIVEGNYDKIKLSSFIDGIVITTHGFAIYSNEEFIEGIVELSNRCGIVILTDSDHAGQRIRNFIKDKAKGGKVLHAYIPDIEGKERRKRKASSEGLLGVEGMDEETIIKALRDAGCTLDNEVKEGKDSKITKAQLYELGLSGGKNSRELREKLAQKIGMPKSLSSNMLLDVLNRLYTYEELVEIIQGISL